MHTLAEWVLCFSGGWFFGAFWIADARIWEGPLGIVLTLSGVAMALQHVDRQEEPG